MALLLSLTTWAVPHRAIGYTLSWSYGLGVFVALLDLVSFFLCMVEFVVRRGELLPSYTSQDDDEDGTRLAQSAEEVARDDGTQELATRGSPGGEDSDDENEA